MRKLGKDEAATILKKQLGWESEADYQNGFWLDDYTFMKPDLIEVKIVEREKYGSTFEKTENMPMLILTDLVEMIVDKNNKVMNVEQKKAMGLWLNDISKNINTRY